MEVKRLMHFVMIVLAIFLVGASAEIVEDAGGADEDVENVEETSVEEDVVYVDIEEVALEEVAEGTQEKEIGEGGAEENAPENEEKSEEDENSGGDVVYVDIEEVVGEEKNESETIDDFAGEINESEIDVESVEENETVIEEEISGGLGGEDSTEILEENVTYVDIEEVVEEEILVEEEEVEEIEKDLPKQKIEKSLVKDGRVEIEFEIVEGEKVDISKKELKKSETEKIVRISSEEHFENELRVYSDLPAESEEGEILIYWETEEEAVTEGIEYFDTNHNGLIDRVSWIVPHLSTQIYSIHVSVDGGSGSSSMDLTVVNPLNGTEVVNPVEFELTVNYTNLTKVNCEIEIDGLVNLPPFDLSGDIFSMELDPGSRDWEIFCWDNETFVNDTATGYFTVIDLSANFDDFYLLGKDDVDGTVVAPDMPLEIYMEYPNSTEVLVENKTSVNAPESLDVSGMINSAGDYSIILKSYNYNPRGIYVENFSVGELDLSFPSNVDEGEEIDFVITTDNIDETVTYDLYLGNDFIEDGSIPFNANSKTESETIGSDGTYTVYLKNVFVDSTSYGDFSFGQIEVEDSQDDEKPDIDLDYPKWDGVVKTSTITFKYTVEDNILVQNCSFKLYNATGGSSGAEYSEDDLVFPISSSDENLAFEKIKKKKEDISLKLVDFDERSYIWEVICMDNSSNEWDDLNFFTVDLDGKTSTSGSGEGYAKQTEVELLLEDLTEFLEKIDDFGLEEQRVLEIMDLSKQMNLHKKRLLQIDQDFRFNLRFMTEDRKANRIDELNEEVESIKEEVVLDLSVRESHEYSKSSLDKELGGILEEYIEATETSINKKSLRGLTAYNEELQKDLSVEIEAWRVEVEYLDKIEDIILVDKNIEIKGDFEGKILEVIPEEFEEIGFVTVAEEVGNGIYEVTPTDLERGNLVYYFVDNFKLSDLENSETVLFEMGSLEGGVGLTGFFVNVGDGISFSVISWILVILIVCLIIFILIWKLRLGSWKKEPQVVKILNLVNQTKVLIRENELDNARGNYTLMGEIYKALPPRCKAHFYKELKKIHLEINKKDVLNLMKEYGKAKAEFRKEDAGRLYAKINSVYTKLPPKYRDKIYQRLVKDEVN